ncbi:nucleolar 14 family protein [Nocardiopsis exhalans]|uniref:Nucleolar 14 family protein n=1 Tax=Nocardiopsis exhalans TaxID=163604 RepID=A0ABY5D9H0_9ACTN|nr:nucleolar 14 family protein [Nocardiopsis exhalans]USY19797.1 nucleolar 14 family protein [Nocardiopsis exhalans]
MLLGLGESHRFEDGFTVTMGPVDRRTDPPLLDESTTDAEDGAEEDADPADDLEDEWDDEGDEEPGDIDGEDLWEDEALEEDPVEESEDDEPAPEEDEPVLEDEGEDPAEDDPVEDEPEDDPVDEEAADEEPDEDEPEEEDEDEGDDYYAWTVELSNGGDAEVHTGSIFTECSVGTPLTLSSAPLLGEALNPPMTLAPDEEGSWDADCWADEDGDPALQWTLEFVDEQGERLYPVLVFEGQAP